jgi:hypothetical protein
MNMKITDKQIKAGIALLAVLVLAGILSIVFPNSKNDAYANGTADCANGTMMTNTEVRSAINSGKIKITFANDGSAHKTSATVVNDTSCSMHGHLNDYLMYDRNLSTQVAYDWTDNTVIPAHTTHTFTIGLPTCMTQIDFYNEGQTVAWNYYENSTHAYQTASGNFCQHDTTLQLSCVADKSNLKTGETETYTANVSGGNGSYTYSWTGTDGLSGSSKAVSKLYSTEGSKSATVTVKSGTQTLTKTCNTVVTKPQAAVAVSCTVNPGNLKTGETATFTAHPTGGNGSYTYSWTGTDNLSSNSQSVSKSYSSEGTKTGTVKVTSNGQTATASCNTVVTKPQATLAVSCAANSSSVRVGNSVAFTAHPTGGNGSYTYSWTGTDGLSGNNQSVNKSYSSTGSKSATIVVTSGSQTASASCDTSVYQPQDNSLYGSCSVDDSNVNIGDRVTWRASASGGNGSYTYDWSGDNGLNGSNSTESKSYSSSGVKYATVRITSNGHTVTSNCSVNVQKPQENLQISCSANPDTADIGEKVTWKADASGGNGNYDYDWSGDDNLNGSSRTESMSYDSAGQKDATVRVTSDDGESKTAHCSVDINDNQPNVTVYTNPDNTTPTSEVYLSQVPYTGPMDNAKMALYILSFFLWSGVVSYFILRKKYGPNTLAMVTAKAGSMRDDFSEKISSLRSIRVRQNPVQAAETEAQVTREEMLKKLWDRVNG